MGINVSRQTAALTATVLIVAFGLLVFLRPARPKVVAAGPESGIAAACSPGSRTGHADLDDNLQTSDRLTLAVRTPSDYDPTRAYPLLVVFPPAGYNRRQSETFYDLTTEATRRGFIIAYSDHIFLSPTAVSRGGGDRRKLFLCR
jgi:polyhydroxybutyrate depolymerase